MKSRFISQIKAKYPALDENLLNDLVADQLLSPYTVPLEASVVQKIKKEIQQYWKLRQWSLKNLDSQYSSKDLAKPRNFSVCMSYDFHINDRKEPELIEINTNAAFLALGLELYDLQNLKNPAGEFNQVSIAKMFNEELNLVDSENEKIVIIDENPQEQRLYVEFLVFEQLLKQNGFETSIADFRNSEEVKQAGLVYNRYTDFYLEKPESSELRKIYNQKKNFSPHPYEYFLLADKQRLIDWYSADELDKPKSLLPIYDLSSSDKEEIWKARKNLFIKPKNSFGSKQAYRAASMSRRMFDEIYDKGFVGQQISTPSGITVQHEGAIIDLKYDLRCYAYQDQLQLIVARLYQGQTTNLKTVGGGFACVDVIK